MQRDGRRAGRQPGLPDHERPDRVRRDRRGPARLGPHGRPRADHQPTLVTCGRYDEITPGLLRDASTAGIPARGWSCSSRARTARTSRRRRATRPRSAASSTRARRDETDATYVSERADTYRSASRSSATSRRDGYVVVRDLVARHEIDELREHTEALMAGELPEQRRVAAERVASEPPASARSSALRLTPSPDAGPHRCWNRRPRPHAEREGAVLPARPMLHRQARAARALPAPPARPRRPGGADRPRYPRPCRRCSS